MHTRDDLSCDRGYEGWLITEAKKRNPSILLYGLSWATPRWVGDGTGNGTGYYSNDNLLYQTKWVECIRNTTTYTVDTIGSWNEKPPPPTDYVKDLRATLDAAGFQQTRISLADGDYSINNMVAQALADPVFNASFVAISRHYPCDTPAPIVESEVHKSFWASEDGSAENTWAGTSCWGRLLNQNYVLMNMTSTINWSLIWAVPKGLPFSGCGLMSAQTPWSGHYTGGDGDVSDPPSLNGPLWTTAHTTHFTAPGWKYLGVGGGGSGFLPPAAGGGSYVTLIPPPAGSGGGGVKSVALGSSPGDFTLVIEKFTGPCKCKPANVTTPVVVDGVASFRAIGGLAGAGVVLHVWRTNATHQFTRDEDITMASDGTFQVFMPADSVATVTTLATPSRSRGEVVGGLSPIPPSTPFALPYADAFSPTTYAYDAQGRFWADQTGSFAVRQGALRQVVPIDPGPNRWVREDVDPITLLGDNSSLSDVTLGVTATFAPTSTTPNATAYVQACARITAYTGLRNGLPPGVCLVVNATGGWVVRTGSVGVAEGVLGGGNFDPTLPMRLSLGVVGSGIVGGVGGVTLFNLTNATAGYDVGLVGLGCGYHAAAFANFSLV